VVTAVFTLPGFEGGSSDPAGWYDFVPEGFVPASPTYFPPGFEFGADRIVDPFTFDDRALLVYGLDPVEEMTVQYVTDDLVAAVPAAVKQATTMLVCHLWRRDSQQNPELQDGWSAVPSGFAVPNAVLEMLAPFKTMPGFA
jgi:hypothetical protein